MNKLKNINELNENNRNFINTIPFLGVYNYNGITYFKCTGYHLNGKELRDIIPNGYDITGVASYWNDLKYTSINIIRLKEV